MTIVALSGGVGGAKLADGLAGVLPQGALTVVTNTGDDFVHLGLHISPDIDTVAYTLSGRADPVRGWGLADETWSAMGALGALGEPDWFMLGDKDLATHLFRTRRLAAGETLSAVTEALCAALGVPARVLPMSDDKVATRVETPLGWLDFQDYFVRHRAAPLVEAIEYAGADSARPAPAVLQALQDAALEAIIICPSNPILSLDPIFAVPGLREAVKAAPVPVVGVSPLVGGKAVKGPTVEVMRGMGLEPTTAAIAHHYGDLLDGFLIDESDAGLVLDCAARAHPTLMRDAADRRRVAAAALDFARDLGAGRR